MDYPVQVEVRLGEGGAELDELQRAGAASLLSGALAVVPGFGHPGGSAVGLAGFGVTAHAGGARLALSLDAPGLEAAEQAARQIVEQVLRGSEALSRWRVTECQASLAGGPGPPGPDAAGDPGAPPPDPVQRAAAPAGRAAALRTSAGPRPDWGEIAEVRTWTAAGASRLRAFGPDAFGYAEDHAGPGVSREAAELAAGALFRSIGPMLDTLFDDAELLRGDATAADHGGLGALDGLPPRFAPGYDALFARRFLVAAVSVTGRLTRPAWEPPACVAEELALRMLIDWAEASLAGFHLVNADERDAAYRCFAAGAVGGADHELLFEPQLGGAGPGPPGASRPAGPAGVAQWFEPFGEHPTVHPYARGPESGEAPPSAGDPGGPGDPARETGLIGQMLAGRLGIDPGLLGPVTDLLAIGLAHRAWQTGRVEEWHASGRLTDADMLRINSHLTKKVREHIGTWLTDRGLSVDGPAAQLDDLTMQDAEDLTRELSGLLANPARRLPSGMTLAGLAGGEWAGYQQEVTLALDRFVADAQARGVRYAVTRAAGQGGLACPHWWSHPRWSALVGRFIAVLDDPASDHWAPGGGGRTRLPPEPAVVADRDELRRVLLASPWKLSTEAAQWVMAAGLGLLRPRL